MSEEQTLSYENNTETVSTEENLNPEEQDSLKVGEQMQEAEEQLLEGKYKDVIYQYDVINVSDENVKNGKLEFSFISVENLNNLDLTVKDFHTIIGDILTELIEDYFIERDKQNRISRTQASAQ